MQAKHIYFLSDFHLGAPNYNDSLVREKKIVQFLDSIQHKASEIFIVGDMFDFWFEYKNVIPKGYTRLLGKLAQLTDNGIAVHFFIGNHDMWMKDYFAKELNIKIYSAPTIFNRQQKSFYIAHGDGLGPGDNGYKFLKKIFTNPICNWLFAMLHPSIGISIANYFSKKSREKTGTKDEIFLGEDKEWLIVHSKNVLASQHINFFVFGHRHNPISLNLNNNSTYINLGDWIKNYTYAEFDGSNMQLKKWEN